MPVAEHGERRHALDAKTGSRRRGAVGGAKDHALVNISTLARVSSPTDSITSGFVISGTTPRLVLVRAVGPSLAGFGLTDALENPQLAIFKGSEEIRRKIDALLRLNQVRRIEESA